MLKLVQFGAGNIGRSFIGQLFARAGYEVVFVDVDRRVIDALNQTYSYRVEIADTPPGEMVIENVRGVDGADRAAVVQELLTARVAGTSVGANALRFIYPAIADALIERRRRGTGPLDIILCENLHGAARIVGDGLRSLLPSDFPFEEAVGLVETSIGKMVPTVPAALREKDPLLVRGERYNTLIVDATAFKSRVPDVPGLDARTNMAAFVARKLYIHNLGHAAVAYSAAFRYPEIVTIGEAVLIPDVRCAAEESMRESAAVLARAYPEDLTEADLSSHIDDLLTRFRNPALGDTVFRVGRDVRRKLGRDDRIVGAMLMDVRKGINPSATARVAAMAMQFQAVGEDGKPDRSDAAFAAEDMARGLDYVLRHVCGLDPEQAIDDAVMSHITRAVSELAA